MLSEEISPWPVSGYFGIPPSKMISFMSHFEDKFVCQAHNFHLSGARRRRHPFHCKSFAPFSATLGRVPPRSLSQQKSRHHSCQKLGTFGSKFAKLTVFFPHP